MIITLFTKHTEGGTPRTFNDNKMVNDQESYLVSRQTYEST